MSDEQDKTESDRKARVDQELHDLAARVEKLRKEAIALGFPLTHEVSKQLRERVGRALDRRSPDQRPSEAAPSLAERLLRLFCGRQMHEAILGDLAEKFDDRVGRFGARRARWWYWRQVIRSGGSFLWRWVRRLVELDEILKRIGF